MATRKTALVTGGTSGVGLSLVKTLVASNFTVYFIGTNLEKGKAVESELNGSSSSVTFIQLDLSDLNAVKAFTERFKSDVTRLDLLANVAGVMLNKRQETVQGLEKTFAIGYLSAFILSTELAPILAQAPQSRIINVGLSPNMLLDRQLDFDNLNMENGYSGRDALMNTLHAKAVMTEILAEKFNAKGIDVNIFNPGAVKSGIGRDMPFPMSVIFKVVTLFFANESKTAAYVSTSDQVIGQTGQLFDKEKETLLSFDQGYKDQLWEKTHGILDQALSPKAVAA